MKQKKSTIKILGITLLVATLVFQGFIVNVASADQITSRSLTLQRRGTVGGSTPGGVVNHLFTFTLPSNTIVGSIRFEYCTTLPVSSSDDCSSTPTGLHTTSSTAGTQVGEQFSTTLEAATDGHPYLTRTPASVTTNAVSYVLESVTNPTAVNKTFFVRITTWAESVPGTTLVDSGSVAASTATQLLLSGTMPESLVFCTGATITKTGGVPDCNAATSPNINFNQLFSPTDTAIATSQMAASTNAGFGYSITVHGPTLTSGSNTISAMSTQGASFHGLSQFGLNLVANVNTPNITTPVGVAIDLPSNGTNLRAQAIGDYNDADLFKFVPDGVGGEGEAVADSLSGSGPVYSTDAQIFTVSYIVNVPGSQPAGDYTTTLTYICTPTF